MHDWDNRAMKKTDLEILTDLILKDALSLPRIVLPQQIITDQSIIRDRATAMVDEIQSGKGMKFDADKPRMDLLDPSFTEGVASVLTFGAKKYSANNWRNGISFTRIISAIHRHLAAIQKGEDNDPETGLPHAYHIGCNCQFLGWMMNNKPELDDRWKG